MSSTARYAIYINLSIIDTFFTCFERKCRKALRRYLTSLDKIVFFSIFDFYRSRILVQGHSPNSTRDILNMIFLIDKSCRYKHQLKSHNLKRQEKDKTTCLTKAR